MASPSSSLATLRPDLARSLMQFDLAMDQAGFIGQKLLPPMPVYEAGGNYGIIPLEQLLRNPETRRQADGSYNRDNFTFETARFVTQEHGLEGRVDDNTGATYANYLDQEMVTTMRTFDGVLRAQEIRCANVFSTANFAHGAPAGTAAWTDHADSTPIDDVMAAMIAVWQASGLWPDSMAITKQLFLHLRRNAQIIEQVKYSGLVDTKTKDITADVLAECLGLDQLVVASSSQNTANPAQTRSISTIWPDSQAIVYRSPKGDTMDPATPCVGRTFFWDESAEAYPEGTTSGGGDSFPVVEVYRSEERRSDIVRVRHQTQETTYYPAAAYIITGVF